MDKKILAEAVEKVIAGGNPYYKEATQFYVDRKVMFLFHGEIVDKDTLDREYRKTAEHDLMNGYKERMVGYYDKWYRYSRADEGRAYDEGVRLAVADNRCKAEFHIIECIQ